MAYTHAKDYLIELASAPQTLGWLKDLIIKVISSNGEISEEELNASLTQLKNNTASTLEMPASSVASIHQDISLISLRHKSGVCALAKDQTIIFSKDITLLYGKNGSGKSSYFRVLNEIIGGNHKTDIKRNIYASSEDDIDIELKYKEGTSIHSLNWDGTTRAINPLSLSSVFDSSYTSTFLQRRSAETAIVFPYGLHLFAALTASMDKMKSRLQTEIDSINSTLPAINLEAVSEDVKRVITQSTFRQTQKDYIQQRYFISEEQLTSIQDCQNRISIIHKTDYDDKIQINRTEHSLFSSLNEHISTCKQELASFIKEGNEIINLLKQSVEKKEKTKAQISILEEIGNTNSKDWQSFISSGRLFVERVSFDSDTCPYCRQKLSEKAHDIIEAYSLYLSDKSINETKELEGKKQNLISRINNFVTSFRITQQFKNLLVSSGDLYEKTISSLEHFSQLKQQIVNAIQEGNACNVPVYNGDITEKLTDIIERLNVQLETLENDKKEKENQLNELNGLLKPLLEIQRISTQKSLFEDWFSKKESIDGLLKCQRELSTRNISSLARIASQTLITDNLKTKFQEELNALGLQKIRVDLVDAGATRGQSFMQLSLANRNSVSDILSEGEQKGVALALFIAEKRMQLSNNPIILDDPVNSLDHIITAKLVERLSTLGNQIIIFSHNLLLQNSLSSLKGVHECASNEITSCKKATKHLLMYLVESRGRDEKGVITEFKQDSVKNNLAKAKRMLDMKPFDSHIALGALLRHTIELMIDEKVFNNQIPVKFHGRKNNISWDQLKLVRADPALIERLNGLFNRLSGGDLHSGIEQSNNPIDYEELKEIYDELNSI